MAKCLNRIQLMGNIGNEPEVKTTASGTKVANFSLATNESWTDKNGQKQERTQWHRCVAWDKVAELIEQYVHKGDRLYVEGKVDYSQSEDKGVTRYWTDIVVRDIIMLGSPSGQQQQQQRERVGRPVKRAAPAGAKKAPNPFDSDDDDLPF